MRCYSLARLPHLGRELPALVVGLRFAFVEAGIAQLIYLVLFSYAFFWKGYTGLAITIMSIVTLFVVMQATGRIRWSERFARARSARPLPGTLTY